MDPYKFIKDLNNPIFNQAKGIKDIISKIPTIQHAPWIKAAQTISSSVNSTQFLETHKNAQKTALQLAIATNQSVYVAFKKSYFPFDTNAFNFAEVERISKIFGNLEKLKFHEFNLEDIYVEKEIEPSIIIDQSSQIKQIIIELYHNNSFIYNLEPRKFEEVIAELLYKKGFEVELTKQTRDKGYDIIALSSSLVGSPLKFLVECKRFRHNKPVGIEVIRSFKDVILEEKANKGILVTSSYFSKPLIERKQKEGNLIDLADKDQILQWIFEYVTKS